MCKITLKGLDKDRFINWIQNAEEKKEDDPVHSFISSWIGFNYYYSTFAIEKIDEFTEWTNMNMSGNQKDKGQWMFLVNHDIFKKFISNLRETKKDIFEKTIELPVKNMMNGKKVPAGKTGEIKLMDLNDVEVFEVLYQIRNNLFHGSKDPEKKERDMKLSTIACQFAVPFLQSLNESTYR